MGKELKTHFGEIMNVRGRVVKIKSGSRAGETSYVPTSYGNTLCGNYSVPTTDDIIDVTCKNCLKLIEHDLEIAKSKLRITDAVKSIKIKRMTGKAISKRKKELK